MVNVEIKIALPAGKKKHSRLDEAQTKPKEKIISQIYFLEQTQKPKGLEFGARRKECMVSTFKLYGSLPMLCNYTVTTVVTTVLIIFLNFLIFFLNKLLFLTSTEQFHSRALLAHILYTLVYFTSLFSIVVFKDVYFTHSPFHL